MEPVWQGSARNPGLVVVAVLSGAVVVVAGRGAAPFYVFGVAIALLVGAFASVRVVVTSIAVSIELGPLRWPRRRIVGGEIQNAEAIDVRPLRYGGWGYRLCGRGCRAYVIRAGDGLALDLSDGRRVIVTVDGASVAAEQVNRIAG